MVLVAFIEVQRKWRQNGILALFAEVVVVDQAPVVLVYEKCQALAD